MLDNIRDAKGIKMEGQKEDVEIRLNDGSYVFAQAKSTMSPDDNSNAIGDLSKALQTLSEADASGCAKKLIFVTNRTNPLNDVLSMRKFANPYSLVEFRNLPETCKERINRICDKRKIALRTDRLSVLALEFPSDNDAGYETIKMRIAEFLVGIDSRLSGFQKEMLDRWQLMFGRNATEADRTKSLTKKDMMWALIVLFCENIDESQLSKYDGADCEDIKEGFSRIIDWHTERFDLFCKVGAEYVQYKAEHLDKNTSELQKSFVEEKNGVFADDFDLDGLDPEIAIEVRKITIDKILQQHRKIAKVKEKVNL